MKELLYILQLGNEADEDLVNRLGEVKDAIGEWHDWYELAAIVGKVLNHGSQCNALKQIRAKVRETFKHALEIANKMRKQYLEGRSSKLRGGSSTKAVARLNLPVVLATTSLAA